MRPYSCRTVARLFPSGLMLSGQAPLPVHGSGSRTESPGAGPERRRAPRRKSGKKQPAFGCPAEQADKADTLSAFRACHFLNLFSFQRPFSSGGRTGGRGARPRIRCPTASRAGHNDGKEPKRTLAPGRRLGNRGNRRPCAEPCRSEKPPERTFRSSLAASPEIAKEPAKRNASALHRLRLPSRSPTPVRAPPQREWRMAKAG